MSDTLASNANALLRAVLEHAKESWKSHKEASMLKYADGSPLNKRMYGEPNRRHELLAYRHAIEKDKQLAASMTDARVAVFARSLAGVAIAFGLAHISIFLALVPLGYIVVENYNLFRHRCPPLSALEHIALFTRHELFVAEILHMEANGGYPVEDSAQGSDTLRRKKLWGPKLTFLQTFCKRRMRKHFETSEQWQKTLTRFIACSSYLDQLIIDPDERIKLGGQHCAHRFENYLIGLVEQYQDQVDAKMFQLFKQRHPEQLTKYQNATLANLDDSDYGLAVHEFEVFAQKALTLPYDVHDWIAQANHIPTSFARVERPRELAVQLLQESKVGAAPNATPNKLDNDITSDVVKVPPQVSTPCMSLGAASANGSENSYSSSDDFPMQQFAELYDTRWENEDRSLCF